MTLVGQWTARQLCICVGVVYPIYQSSRALQRQDKHELLQWTTFWTVNALFWALETVGDTVVGWVPFYFEAKIALLCWLVLPQYCGARVLHEKWLAPTFEKHEDVIDDAISDIKRRASEKVLQVCKDTAVLALRRGSGVMAQGQQFVTAQLVQQALGKLQQSPPASETQELRVPAILSFLTGVSAEPAAPRKSFASTVKVEAKDACLEKITEEKFPTSKSNAESKAGAKSCEEKVDRDAKSNESVPAKEVAPSKSQKWSNPVAPASAKAMPPRSTPPPSNNQDKSKELVSHFKKLLVKGFLLKYYPAEGVLKHRTLRLLTAQSRYLVFEGAASDTTKNKNAVALFVHNVRRLAATKTGDAEVSGGIDNSLAFVLDNGKTTLLFEAESTKTRDLLVAGMRLLVNEHKRNDTIALATLTTTFDKLVKQRAFDRMVCRPSPAHRVREVDL